MEESAFKEFQDGIRRATKSISFQILTEIHTILFNEPNVAAIRYFWKRFRVVGYSKIKRIVDLYFHRFGYYEIGPERFSRIRCVSHSKHVIDIGIFLVHQAYFV